MGFVESLTVIGTALLSMLASEALSWLLVYRTPKYKAGIVRVKALSRKFDLAKRADPSSKKVTKYRAQLKQLASETTGSNMKSMLLLGLLHWFTFALLSRYDSIVVARLPFHVQFGLLQGFSHRGLTGKKDSFSPKLLLTTCFFFKAMTTLKVHFCFCLS